MTTREWPAGREPTDDRPREMRLGRDVDSAGGNGKVCPDCGGNCAPFVTDGSRCGAVSAEPAKPKRVPVDYRYDAINPTFLKWMAKIGAYATDKYGAWEQYKDARLVGEKSPVNHIYEHLRSYTLGERYDHFDGDVRWHLVAVAYNAMMEFFYCTRWGHAPHPLTVDESERP